MLVGILLDATSSDFDVSFDFYGKMDGFSEFRYGSGADDALVEMIVASVVGGGAEKERFGEVDLRKGVVEQGESGGKKFCYSNSR